MSLETAKDSAAADGQNTRPRVADAGEVTIVIVTYKRTGLLAGLLSSIALGSARPGRVLVVDNAGDPEVAEEVGRADEAMPDTDVVHLPMTENVGGAGGFAAGLSAAVERGSGWIWLMDDDVEVLPEGLERLLSFTPRFKAMLGRRYDTEGRPFFWQQRFNAWLGFPVSVPGDPFRGADHWLTNCGCFEGLFIHRDVVEAVGVPDARFFMTWDDTIYGWQAARHFDIAYVDAFVLKKMRAQRRINLGIRHLNDASDLARFHTMRNRALVRHHLLQAGAYRPVGFALGTALTLGKELMRLVMVERSLSGLPSLFKGMEASRRLRRELKSAGAEPAR